MQIIKTISSKSMCMILLAVMCNISAADSIPGYTIITTTEIQNTSEKLPDFVAHKESLGFDVQVITEADFGGGIGDEAAENIRAWLQNNYLADNIKYVLFIGNLDPNDSEIPMKWLWADEGKVAASDFYFAELTGNWDLDGDGLAGEWGDDFGWQDVDRQAEVLVGRIPYYGEIVEVDNILNNTILYESSTSQEWRKSVLLAMTNDGLVLGETIKDSILGPAGWSWHRVYQEDHDLDPPPETIPCNKETVCSVWSGKAQNSDGKFGLVIWAGEHGHNMVTSDCDFDSNFPSFTFQPPCTEGGVELRYNLAYKLLTNGGAICTVAATLGSKYTGNMFVGNSNTMAYEYTSRLVAGLSAGEALYDLKRVMRLPRDMYWRNWVVYNIYGDPSLKLVSPIGRTIYVDSNTTGHGDGSSWEDAYIFLQDALTTALPGDEIRIASGTYKPDQGARQTLGDREATFHLVNDVNIVGGYAGFGTDDPNTRNTELYQTILSGDLDGNDVDVNEPTYLLDEPTKAENSYHVVTAPSGICYKTVLDGVIISGGNANGENTNGGGIYNEGGHPTICNCIFKQNHANSHGGAIYNIYGGIIMSGCVFEYNSARYGGGFMNNKANPTLFNCIFSGNSARWGAAIESGYSTLSLKNCSLFRNDAIQNGGSLFNNNSHSIFTNCILWDNTALSGAQICNEGTSTATVSYSDVQDVEPSMWSGEGNINTNPLFADPNNGDYHLKSQAGRWDPNSRSLVQDAVTSPCIDAGDPNSDWSEELWPHGKRINIGAYGGTAEASMSPSDIGDARDLNNDDSITWDDVLLLADKWDSNDILLREDFDLNGIVDSNDLVFFYGNWPQDSNNSAPVLELIDNQYTAVGELLSFSVSALDNDGDELVYEAFGLPDGAIFSEQLFSWTAQQAGIYPVTFVVSDYKSLDYVNVEITVEEQ